MGVWNKLRRGVTKHSPAVDAAVEPATKKMKAAPEVAAAAPAATPEAVNIPADSKVVEGENEVAKTEEVIEKKQEDAGALKTADEDQKVVATVTETQGNKAVDAIPEAEMDLSAISHVDNTISSFKEESNFIADLKESEKKALQEFKEKIEALIKSNGSALPPNVEAVVPKATAAAETEAIKTTAVEENSPTEGASNDNAPAVAVKSTEVPVEAGSVESQTKEVEAVTVEAPVETTPAPEAKAAVETTTAAAELEVPVETAKVEVPVETTPTPPEVEATVVEITPRTPEVETPATDAEVPEVETKEAVSETKVATEPEETTKEVATETAVVEESKEEEEQPLTPPEDISLWGVPLSETKGDERTNVILLKFLRARDFKVDEACSMLVNTIRWRKSFNADTLLEEDLGSELDCFFYMQGSDKEDHPVCYNIWGAFQDKDLYQKTFGDATKSQNFVRWRVQVLEKGIKQLNFVPGGTSAILQVNDVKNIPFFKKEMLRTFIGFITLLQDNYPELVVKNVFVNTPWYFSAFYSVISPFITQRMKRKLVLARPGQIFKSIAPENVPVQYGGFAQPNDVAFAGVKYSVEQLSIKAGEKESIEIALEQAGSTAVWDLSVIGWDISYGVEFAPTATESYHSIIEKTRKIVSVEVPIRTTFRCVEPGKLVLSIDNTASRKKKLVVYRFTVAAAPGAVTTAEL